MATTAKDGRILWHHAEMILAAVEHWGDETIYPRDCEVIGAYDAQDHCCLVVLHRPSGRTSNEAGNAGRWHTDGTAYEV